MRLSAVSLCALALVFAASPSPGGETGKIAGRVTDARTKERLLGVNIMIVGTKQGATSDVQGDFFIINVAPGTYTLKASQVGYTEVLINGVRVRTDATTQQDFQMEQTVLDVGQEVVVTAQRPLVEKDNTSSRVYIESTEITSRPATAVADIVATLPSVNVENGVMKVRGGTLNEVSFLIDGTRAWNPLNQDPYTNINLSSIQELEVITGSYNAEYGEARSGIFNVITKEGSAQYHGYLEARYQPPGVKHWGPSLYDPNTPLYWENTHARHLQWWIDNPDQWVDQNGVPGSDPRCSMTPESAYNNYLATHKPLTAYDKLPDVQLEASLGGPVPAFDNLTFFVTGKYHSEPALMGNAFYDRGEFWDFTGKFAYQLDPKTKVLLSAFSGSAKTAWGIGGTPDVFWAENYGINSRYAYYDIEGTSPELTNGVTARLTHFVSDATMFEVTASHSYAKRVKGIFPGDPIGWDATQATTDLLRAGVPGGNQDNIGYHTAGYYDRHEDRNTTWTASGYYSSQMSRYLQLKSGAEFTYYNLDHYNESKLPPRVDDGIYNPYQGAAYAEGKLEFTGFIMNLGLRYDFYNDNDVVYTSFFDPLGSPAGKSQLFSQLSPRLGISHPIDEYTVLHFSYGHFFQRPPFGDYGEGNNDEQAVGTLTTFRVIGSGDPWVLGNRDVKPEHTIAYELGIERNFFDEFVLGVTAYYKDIRNLIQAIAVVDPPRETYRTNANADYADVRGFEVSLRKQPVSHSWGTTWGYLNFTTQVGINGRSGYPQAITPTGPLYPASGDYIVHNNPRLKAGLYYETPASWDFLAGALSGLSVSVDYQAVLPNDQLLSDYIALDNGQKAVRPLNQNTNLKVRKDFAFGHGGIKLGVYAEIRNLFDNKWINIDVFNNSASSADKQHIADSGFSWLPSFDAHGTPILDLAKYVNLPRAVIFGATIEL
ncbi:MAG TPA: TonB-dependent receptor [Bacteroidota bacterium]|nr:TonB-dependent receptor [Bacteroidota bacterium]